MTSYVVAGAANERAAHLRETQQPVRLDNGRRHVTEVIDRRSSVLLELGLGGQRLPELNLIPIRVIDPGKATVGFIHSFGVNLYPLLF